jgi:carbohydrate kinase (thermoresistant glucokinase family)
MRSGQALVIMGVSGSGKSTVGALLAERLGWEMMEGDRLHPPANVEKMRRGIPLDDADRGPWLDKIGEELEAWAAAGRSGVLTCSALKRAYRARILAARPDLRFVYLKGSQEVIAGRVNARRHEYMPASLLKSQFETLEEPAPGEPVITVDVGETPDREVEAIIDALDLSGSRAEPGASS